MKYCAQIIIEWKGKRRASKGYRNQFCVYCKNLIDNLQLFARQGHVVAVKAFSFCPVCKTAEKQDWNIFLGTFFCQGYCLFCHSLTFFIRSCFYLIVSRVCRLVFNIKALLLEASDYVWPRCSVDVAGTATLNAHVICHLAQNDDFLSL